MFKRRSTAILLFTNTISREVETKTFCHKRKFNIKIAASLIRHSITVAKKSGLDYFIIDSDHQVGSTFGERYSHSFQQVFNKGYDKVISIGNDCPSLTINLIINAADKLSFNDLVIGPAKDGGAYLIGLTRSSFDQEKFSNLKWKSAQVFSNLQDYANEFDGQISCLLPLSDVDTAADLLRIVYQRTNQSFLYQLKQLLQLIRRIFIYLIPTIQSDDSRFTIGLRAPPAL